MTNFDHWGKGAGHFMGVDWSASPIIKDNESLTFGTGHWVESMRRDIEKSFVKTQKEVDEMEKLKELQEHVDDLKGQIKWYEEREDERREEQRAERERKEAKHKALALPKYDHEYAHKATGKLLDEYIQKYWESCASKEYPGNEVRTFDTKQKDAKVVCIQTYDAWKPVHRRLTSNPRHQSEYVHFVLKPEYGERMHEATSKAQRHGVGYRHGIEFGLMNEEDLAAGVKLPKVDPPWKRYSVLDRMQLLQYMVFVVVGGGIVGGMLAEFHLLKLLRIWLGGE